MPQPPYLDVQSAGGLLDARLRERQGLVLEDPGLEVAQPAVGRVGHLVEAELVEAQVVGAIGVVVEDEDGKVAFLLHALLGDPHQLDGEVQGLLVQRVARVPQHARLLRGLVPRHGNVRVRGAVLVAGLEPLAADDVDGEVRGALHQRDHVAELRVLGLGQELETAEDGAGGYVPGGGKRQDLFVSAS